MEINITENGATESFHFQGKGTVILSGEFDGATVSLQAKATGDNVWVAAPDGNKTAATLFNIDIARADLRFNTTAADTNTNVNAEVYSLRDLRST